jgi:putative FmdB family regulatory protein
MPNYEYVCVECANRVEVFHRIGDEPLRVCEVCGGQMRKVFHPAGIVLKGSGFYRTDSRKTAKAGKEGSGSGSKGDGKKGADTSSSEKSSSEKSSSDGSSSEKSSSESSSDSKKKEAS